MCSRGWPQIYCLASEDLHLSVLPECWDYLCGCSDGVRLCACRASTLPAELLDPVNVFCVFLRQGLERAQHSCRSYFHDQLLCSFLLVPTAKSWDDRIGTHTSAGRVLPHVWASLQDFRLCLPPIPRAVCAPWGNSRLHPLSSGFVYLVSGH